MEEQRETCTEDFRDIFLIIATISRKLRTMCVIYKKIRINLYIFQKERLF